MAPAGIPIGGYHMSRSSIIPRPEAVIGLDVGKFSHWAYGIGATGEVTADFPVDNREAALDSFFEPVEPGIGVHTATELVVSIDISRFADHGKLASYCGLAPRDSKSGTSISAVTSSKRGNKRLKNLLIFSCNSLTNSKNRFGEYYRMLRDVRHMPHGKALKAVARKRLKVIYAIMRDKVPYAA